MTIYNAIKNMTVEQMALFLFPQGSSHSCPLAKLKLCECSGYPNSDSGKRYCINQIINWLESEVEISELIKIEASV